MKQIEPNNFYVDYEAEVFCKRHGPTTVVRTGVLDGYDGGVCTFWKLECGCTLIDEEGDINSAE